MGNFLSKGLFRFGFSVLRTTILVIDEKKIIFFEALDGSVTCQLVLIVNRPLSIETSRKRHPIFVPPVLLDFAIYATWYKTTR
jgi:hypothetical protein